MHAEHAWTKPTRVEVRNDGFLVVDYELVAGAAISPQFLGEQRLLAIRDAMLRFGFKNFRVNVNGPRPGSGLVRRFGSARYIDPGPLEWITP